MVFKCAKLCVYIYICMYIYICIYIYICCVISKQYSSKQVPITFSNTGPMLS